MSTTSLFDIFAHKITALHQHGATQMSIQGFICQKCDALLLLAYEELISGLESFMQDPCASEPATHMSIADLATEKLKHVPPRHLRTYRWWNEEKQAHEAPDKWPDPWPDPDC